MSRFYQVQEKQYRAVLVLSHNLRNYLEISNICRNKVLVLIRVLQSSIQLQLVSFIAAEVIKRFTIRFHSDTHRIIWLHEKFYFRLIWTKTPVVISYQNSSNAPFMSILWFNWQGSEKDSHISLRNTQIGTLLQHHLPWDLLWFVPGTHQNNIASYNCLLSCRFRHYLFKKTTHFDDITSEIITAFWN
jgi:hypothetical protein